MAPVRPPRINAPSCLPNKRAKTVENLPNLLADISGWLANTRVVVGVRMQCTFLTMFQRRSRTN